MRKSIKRAGFVGVSVLAASSVGIAFAAWTSNGSGSGSAASGANTAISATTASTSGLLFPSGSAAVTLTLVNPNPYPVTVTQINNGTGAITSGDAACDAANGVSFSDQTGSWTIPAKTAAGNGTVGVTLASAARMSNDSNNACQSKTFTIPVALVGASS